jgi:hypothetical protein
MKPFLMDNNGEIMHEEVGVIEYFEKIIGEI